MAPSVAVWVWAKTRTDTHTRTYTHTTVVTIQGHCEPVHKQRQTTRTNNTTSVLVISGWLGTNCLSECVSFSVCVYKCVSKYIFRNSVSLCMCACRWYTYSCSSYICASTWNHHLYRTHWDDTAFVWNVYEAASTDSIILNLSCYGSNIPVSENKQQKWTLKLCSPSLSTDLFFFKSPRLAYSQHLQHSNSHSSMQWVKLQNKIKKKTHYTVLDASSFELHEKWFEKGSFFPRFVKVSLNTHAELSGKLPFCGHEMSWKSTWFVVLWFK